jgi:hypothetical protein
MNTKTAMAAVSASLIMGEWTWPLHGMRYHPEGSGSGWFWWTGEWSDDEDFFQPVHGFHLVDTCPVVAEYLDAPPGTRVLLFRDYADVWTDEALLEA